MRYDKDTSLFHKKSEYFDFNDHVGHGYCYHGCVNLKHGLYAGPSGSEKEQKFNVWFSGFHF